MRSALYWITVTFAMLVLFVVVVTWMLVRANVGLIGLCLVTLPIMAGAIALAVAKRPR